MSLELTLKPEVALEEYAAVLQRYREAKKADVRTMQALQASQLYRGRQEALDELKDAAAAINALLETAALADEAASGVVVGL